MEIKIVGSKIDFSTGGFLIGGFINPGGPPFLNYIFFGQRGLINTAGFINPNLTLFITNYSMFIAIDWLLQGLILPHFYWGL